ncbi:hypothetical protein JOD57_001848 [Geodermatophilus bullaregiensis]|uniref:hypothetical protein n=1 Tax=Geodermatophilus bullaregiensis TaxID=1564160 RepID=UPI001956379E|nr:hypothetical protein [Geodermatophilus bullaregiensis]MBM7806011.1 hypothetical protein [Geodermatophilus bullaregiensis]
MTTTRVLAELGERIAEEGPAAHDRLLQHLSHLVADSAPGSAAALADRNAPDVVRQRALAVASAVLLRRPAANLVAVGLAA